MAFKQTLDMTTQNTFYYLFSEEMKDKCIAIIQKQIILKITIWWREFYKISMRIWNDSRRMVLASPSVSQTSLMANFKSLVTNLQLKAEGLSIYNFFSKQKVLKD